MLRRCYRVEDKGGCVLVSCPEYPFCVFWGYGGEVCDVGLEFMGGRNDSR